MVPRSSDGPDGLSFSAAPTRSKLCGQDHIGYGWTPGLVEEYLTELDKDGSPTAYVFRCRHCGTHVAYSDFD